ncbi:MAG: hypothetical protein K0B09_09645 [Bacteroidales bacterium]|nr:hypothetical protein [Bacteroidales bacterium]
MDGLRLNQNLFFILGGIFFCIFFLPNAEGQGTQNSIKGEWLPMFQNCQNEGSLTFGDEHLEGKSFNKTRQEYFLSDYLNPDGSSSLRVFNFEVSFDNGESYSKVAGSEGMVDTSLVHVYFINEDIMVHVGFKMGKRVHHHYRRPAVFLRAEAFENYQAYVPEVQKVFVLPDDFTGRSWIAHEQPDGEVEERDSLGRLVLRIPNSGFLLTQASPMPVALALQGFDFFFESDYKKEEPIPKITINCLNFFRNKWSERQSSDFDITDLGFDLEKIYVCAFTYNTPQRDQINKMFGKNIEGQVMYFQVDTLKNLIINANTWEGR